MNATPSTSRGESRKGKIMSVKMRLEVERKIVGAAVDAALAAGYRVTVSLERGYDHDDCLLGSTDREKIMEEAFAGDDCHLFIHEATGPLVEERTNAIISIGWIYVVFGNDGWDCISDYTTNLESLLTDAKKISDHYSS